MILTECNLVGVRNESRYSQMAYELASQQLELREVIPLVSVGQPRKHQVISQCRLVDEDLIKPVSIVIWYYSFRDLNFTDNLTLNLVERHTIWRAYICLLASLKCEKWGPNVSTVVSLKPDKFTGVRTCLWTSQNFEWAPSLHKI